MSNPFAAFTQARLLATGSSLDIDPPNLSPSCNTDAELKTLVSAYYIFFNEGLAKDRSFLLSLHPNPQLDQLRQLLYNLRTANEHIDNDQAVRTAARWRNQFNSPQDAANALAAALAQGLAILGKIAVAAGYNAAEVAQWRQLLSVDVGSVFSAVSADLGLSFRQGDRKRMIRFVEKRLEVRPDPGDRRQVVAEYCAQEILSDRRPLPVPYHEVLDALGLLGTSRAPGAIMLAYSVAELSPSLRGEDFITRVEETWRAAHAP